MLTAAHSAFLPDFITLLAEAAEQMVHPPLSHCNSKLDVFTSGSTWRGAQICGGYIHPSNGQNRVHRTSSSFLSSGSKSKCYPSGLKTNASPLLPWVAKRKEEEGGLRWRPRVTDMESCIACFCRSPEWDERGGENPRLA